MDTSSVAPLRTCTKCGNQFPETAEYFHRSKSARNGLVARCKACVHEKSMDWYSKPGNAEHSRQSARQWKLDNPEKKRDYELRTAEHRAAKKREWRKANPDKVKQHKSESQKRNRAAATERLKRHNERHPNHYKARYAVTNAVKLGKLKPVKECLCASCGATASEYHHWSYEPEHWLNVIPLCHDCHVETRK